MTPSWDEVEQARVRARLMSIAEPLPDVVVEDSHGHTGFLLRGSKFAWLLVDHHGDGRLALWVKAPRGEQESLVGGDGNQYFVPPYVGHQGWVGALLDSASKPNWDEIGTLVEQAWRMSATKRAVAAYDEARGADAPHRG